VKDELAADRLGVVNAPRKSMGRFNDGAIPKSAVTLVVLCAYPIPTFLGLLNLRPKTGALKSQPHIL